MTALELRRIGNSVGVILPKDMLARLKIEKGKTLRVAKKRRAVLRELAKRGSRPGSSAPSVR